MSDETTRVTLFDAPGSAWTTRTAGPGSPPVSEARRARVDKARTAWIQKLIDLSRRNNLLFFRDLKVGTLDLSDVPAAEMEALLQSGRSGNGGVSLARLLPAHALTQAAASLRAIADRAQWNYEERGLDTLFMALGIASWSAEDGGRPTSAPVLLVPIEARRAGSSGTWTLRRAGDVQVNAVLLHALETHHGRRLDPDAVTEDLLGDDEGESFDLAPALERVTRAGDGVAGFSVEKRVVLGNFSFQKMAIVRDLRQLGDALAEHDIIAGIAGDTEAAQRARGSRATPDPREFDAQPPDNDFLVLDADSSQQQAIAAVTSDQSGVISGPPGTGKSQTIANLIAELTARGKTVLFVAEKRAALDVVLNRLRDVGLEHLCLDLHGAETSRRAVARQLEESIHRVRETLPPVTAALHDRFVERRRRLNRHAGDLHERRPPSRLSVYEIYGALLALGNVTSTTRFVGKSLDQLTPQRIAAAVELLTEAAPLAELWFGDHPSPWKGATFRTSADVERAIEAVRDLVHAWPACQAQVTAHVAPKLERQPKTLGQLRGVLSVLDDTNRLLDDYREELFQEDLPGLTTDLHRAATPFSRATAWLSPRYRRARRIVSALYRRGKVPPAEALEAVKQASAVLVSWHAMGGGHRPRSTAGLAELQRHVNHVAERLGVLLLVFPSRGLDGLDLASLGTWITALAGDAITPVQLLRLHQIQQELVACGVESIFTELASTRDRAEAWPRLLRHVWLTSCLEAQQRAHPELTTFQGRTHDGLVAEFQQLDRGRLTLAVDRVRRAHAERAVQARNGFDSQNTLVSRESQKKTRHLPLRKLFAEAPDVLLGLRPCWMASPLSVSNLIPGDRPYFDVVVFDEASQVLPEDAVTSLLRGRRAVIAGDARQLPPTTFFASGTDEDTEEDDGGAVVAGFESVLDVMSAFLDPAWSLDWHYRSRDEALIAFSNHHIYGDRLVTFPGAGLDRAVSWLEVPFVPGQGGPEESAAREVEEVVRLVLEHATARPDESLGVIALGIKHADRVLMALERARHEHPELDDFFRADRHERFFVKNLERVQGDEREAIILTVGYTKDETGRLKYRFGPLLQQGGERRLNVAVTRARRRITLVSSFSHADIDPNHARDGVRLLRAYLEFASSGGRTLDSGTITKVPLNEFEQSVFDTLTQHGLTLIPQLGASRYRIDMVATHPSRPGRFVLAIECDGASYHASPTARDRDRLRQQHLEALGWRFLRIWSTDWFLRRDEEVARALATLKQTVAWADAQDASGRRESPAATQVLAVADVSSKPAWTPRDVLRARPFVPPGKPIEKYSPWDLQEMVTWVTSDGRNLTDGEIVEAVSAALGFKRQGSRIVHAIRAAIEATRKRERGT